MSQSKERKGAVVGLALLALAAALPAQQVKVSGKILEMTYPYEESTVFWPTAKPFHLEKLNWGVTAGGWWYASNEYSASEHGGTHADAPIHFAEGGRTIDRVPLAEWVGPAVKIDVSSECRKNRDYGLTVEDIAGWEKRYGRIPDGAWVMMYTGIGTEHYPDKKRVLGTDKRGEEAIPELSFPGFSPEAAEFLVKERNIAGVGLDTPSIDAGKRTDFKVHRIICGADKLALENIANLDELPASGATLFVIPMLIKDGTGSPARVFALLPEAPASSAPASAESSAGELTSSEVDRLCRQVEPRVIAWRRDIHEHPELGNREFRTAKLVAGHLQSLGIETKSGVAKTGVVGLLTGGRPGPVVALRADMDALPVKELTGLPFASKVVTTYNGQEVGVMHACGHDAHTAILMGAAEVLAGLRDRLPGAVKFIFQPAEDSRPENEEGGAALMIKEGILENPRPDAIFALHVFPFEHGAIAYRPGGFMAASNNFSITVKGRQTHGAIPWAGIDPVSVSAQIVLGLQTIISRQMDLTSAPAVISVTVVRAGVQNNIIPQEVVLGGTIRTLDPEMRKEILDRVRRTAESIAGSAGAEATVSFSSGLPPLLNDPVLTKQMVPVLESVVGKEKVVETPPLTTSEDFAYFSEKIPGLYISLGINAPGADPAKVFPNHSPYFRIEESALLNGVKALVHLAMAWLSPGLKI